MVCHFTSCVALHKAPHSGWVGSDSAAGSAAASRVACCVHAAACFCQAVSCFWLLVVGREVVFSMHVIWVALVRVSHVSFWCGSTSVVVGWACCVRMCVLRRGVVSCCGEQMGCRQAWRRQDSAPPVCAVTGSGCDEAAAAEACVCIIKVCWRHQHCVVVGCTLSESRHVMSCLQLCVLYCMKHMYVLQGAAQPCCCFLSCAMPPARPDNARVAPTTHRARPPASAWGRAASVCTTSDIAVLWGISACGLCCIRRVKFLVLCLRCLYTRLCCGGVWHACMSCCICLVELLVFVPASQVSV